ncbi:fus1p [Saccharomyces arboricola H-6]|uniref:Fus1p n=1 Tax=Saccharomyces arboricola (strain H-6 / AS 2.3317 / CBS 10644) TaxID=1160507 RepID=J8PQX5_SACAR|nr:fus1p [Saccharomyces arboricola H-6]
MQTTTTVMTTIVRISTALTTTGSVSSHNGSSTTTMTATTAATSAYSAPSNLLFSNVAAQPESSSASTIGLSIGLPIGIFCFGLLVLLCYFYIKRNSMSISNPPMSATIPSEERRCRHTNWFTRLFKQHEGSYSDFNRDIEKYNDTQWTSGDNMSSKIQYKISKPILPQHILTPKKTVKNPYNWSNNNVSLDPNVTEKEDEKFVDTFLYTKPPNIFPIESKMPSYNDLSSQKTASSSKKPPLKTGDKWNYDSPLSRWFLRGSTYFKDYALSKTSLKTPSAAPQLKRMKMLSRISKGYFNESDILQDERSPILEYNNTILHPHDSLNDLDNTTPDSQVTSYPNGNVDLIMARPNSVIYGTTGQQTLDFKGNDRNYCNTGIDKHDLIITPTISKSHKKRKKRRQSKMYQQLQYLSRSKPLPLTPESKSNADPSIQLGGTYTVIQDYEPRLTDEISISLGEKVKILATHTDGWCLVEKCNAHNNHANVSADDKRYLNEDRGIVPGDCLQEYD